MADPQALLITETAWRPMSAWAARRANWPWLRRSSISARRRNRTPSIRPSGRPSEAARTTGSLMPPAHILNAPTKLMRELGYGEGYAYDHGEDEAFSGQNYFPDGMARERILPARRARLRARDRQAPRLLGEAARQTPAGARAMSAVEERTGHAGRGGYPARPLVPAPFSRPDPGRHRKALPHRADPRAGQAVRSLHPAPARPDHAHSAAGPGGMAEEAPKRAPKARCAGR